MTLRITAEEVERTRQVLKELAQRQERLGVQLEGLKISDFVDRAEWLASQRTPDEADAHARHWGRLFRRYRVPLVRQHRNRPRRTFASLSVPRPQPVFEPWQERVAREWAERNIA